MIITLLAVVYVIGVAVAWMLASAPAIRAIRRRRIPLTLIFAIQLTEAIFWPVMLVAALVMALFWPVEDDDK